jgi:hypothetical protein
MIGGFSLRSRRVTATAIQFALHGETDVDSIEPDVAELAVAHGGKVSARSLLVLPSQERVPATPDELADPEDVGRKRSRKIGRVV